MSYDIRPFRKPAKRPEDLLTRLVSRGLVVENPSVALGALRFIGHYRLLTYMRPFQDQATKHFRSGTTFSDILTLYEFDRQLRLICLNALERVEVSLRGAIVNTLGVLKGAHFYGECRHFTTYQSFSGFLRIATSAEHAAVRHYRTTHNDPSTPPIWVLAEALTFGEISRLFSDLHIANRKIVAREFELDESVLTSWFRSLTVLRNMCAHQVHLWNAHLPVNQPKAAKAFHKEFIRLDSFYARAVVLNILLGRTHDPSAWRRELVAHVTSHPLVDPADMGFPPDWRHRELWQ